MIVTKIQDTGAAPLDGRQEQFWQDHIIPKYEKIRPGFKVKLTPQENILKQYNFKAFEYGHWTTQNERFDFLAAAQASFSDLKKVTGLSSLGFDLIGIAYGARGKGGRAMAHFEPWSYMINLTRPHGLTTLAHEYGHALDYYFGHFAEPSQASRSLSGGHTIGASGLDIPATPGSLRDTMHKLQKAIMRNGADKSESYKRLSAHCGTNVAYWMNHTEIFARTFEQCVQYKLIKKGITNHLLTKTKYADSWAYLTEKDLIRVMPLMDKLIKTMAQDSRDWIKYKRYYK
jgi:hypothetical protein